VILGLNMIGLFRIRALFSEKRFHTRFASVGYLGAFMVGVTFAFGWAPCIGPLLAAMLALAADSKTVLRGSMLLAVYSLGLGVPFLAAGFATGTVIKALSRFKKHFRKIEIVSGVLVILVGFLVFFNRLSIIH